METRTIVAAATQGSLATLAKRLRWTRPWFLVSAIKGEGTRELCYAVMEFLENERRRRK